MLRNFDASARIINQRLMQMCSQVAALAGRVRCRVANERRLKVQRLQRRDEVTPWNAGGGAVAISRVDG